MVCSEVQTVRLGPFFVILRVSCEEHLRLSRQSWCDGNIPQAILRVACSMKDHFSLFDSVQVLFGQEDLAIVITKLAQRDKAGAL